MIKKVIVIESCKDCPYSFKDDEGSEWVCALLDIDITEWYNKGTICGKCELDNVHLEKRYVNSKSDVITKGYAKHVGGIRELKKDYYYEFRRQIDGNVRVYASRYVDDKTSKYVMLAPRVFTECFDVEEEKVVKKNKPAKQKTCPRCLRPIRWCECLPSSK